MSQFPMEASPGLRRAIASAMVVTMVVMLTSNSMNGEEAVSFARDVGPVLQEMCVSCHGAKRSESDLRMDRLAPDLMTGPDAETWHDVLNRVNLGEMPPEDAPQLSPEQRQRLVSWLTAGLREAAAARRSTGGRVVLRRLTRYEYQNTLRDLLGVDLQYGRDLPPESSSADGFQNNGATLGIAPLQVELYLAAARAGLSKAIVVGERPEVFTHRAEKSEKIRRVKGPVSNRLAVGDRFLARMEEFPREGEIRVRVTAGAVTPANSPFPRLRIALGVRADVRAPEKTLAQVDVTASEDMPQTFEFLGRIEDFPLPGHNPKYPGLQITLYNESPDRVSAAPAKQKKRKKKKAAATAAPETKPDEAVIVIRSVEFEGPFLESWPPPSHTRILPDGDRSDEREYVRSAVRRFLTRAYRRPAGEADTRPLMELYERLRPRYDTLEETMREVLSAALISPDFLYLVEPREDPDRRERVTDFQLASRMSYFLWSTMPDQRLFDLAACGSLRSAEVLSAKVVRMLEDPRSQEFVKHFTNQWFDLAAVDRIAVNPEFYPQFDDRLKADMRAETQAFFGEIFEQNLSCLTLLDADFTMANYSLAKHYGLSGPRTSSFQRVALSPDDHRGGLLAQGSFLLANSNGEDSHPIKRAVWLLDRLLDSPPAPPPPDVPDLDPDEPELAGLPLKRQLEIHRKKTACNHCHRGIDPWGVALENYDAVGLFRNGMAARKPAQGRRNKPPSKGAPMDATATLPDGTKVDGLPALKRYLLTRRRDQFARAIVKRLLAYSLGRSLEFSDQQTIDSLTARFAGSDYRLRSLIVEIVRSEAFQMK